MRKEIYRNITIYSMEHMFSQKIFLDPLLTLKIPAQNGMTGVPIEVHPRLLLCVDNYNVLEVIGACYSPHNTGVNYFYLHYL